MLNLEGLWERNTQANLNDHKMVNSFEDDVLELNLFITKF